MTTRWSSTMAKPQFGPWLIQQVESRQYEGLYMISPGRFRIPWKHNARRNLEDEDVKIFKEWAIVSGKIRENPANKARWKTNFRCALEGQKMFMKIADNSKDQDEPHKVYCIINPQGTQNAEPTQNPIFIPQIYADQMPQNTEQDLCNPMYTMCINQQDAVPQILETLPSPQNGFFEPLVSGAQCFQNNTPPPVQPPYTTASQHNLPGFCSLEITINYRKTEVSKTVVDSQLVQFHYQCNPSEVRGHPIPFPSIEKLIDHKQIQYTQRLLDSIQRGLLLEVTHDGIYGFRQDMCNVFVCTSDPSEIQNPEPQKLRQNTSEQLFSFRNFTRDLMEFTGNRRGSPDYTIYLCFGEKLPDGKPLQKKLIVVKVVPLICRELHARAQLDGASSLQNDNVSLQISHNSLYDLINSLGLPFMDISTP
ncbi:Interferon regulatory factor 3 [Triplophysa tibetana]|uniref:Interferon regulatory factor 3 n=1 Tax=Triplophysa tibetana TaxID=1572043 RepID=A0A5A9PQX8_9TELE|nr:Interferon regulatory factor 3 [Triplophysa tibetana]